ncbi:MAG: transposase [Deltaproteobacteria bacterium]|nr:transposase [Deltaproteobacteria bacterium]
MICTVLSLRIFNHLTIPSIRQRKSLAQTVLLKSTNVSSERLTPLDYLILKSKNSQRTEKKGIILVADSTFLITSGSTKGQKDEQGQWHFNDESVAFSGQGRHRHNYPVGHKAHSVRTINGVPMVPILSPANESDQVFIIPLIEELASRYPNMEFSYIILDKGYDTEEIHHDIYEFFGVIPVIIRKKMVYPEEFTKDGYPLCPWGFAMKPRGIDYERRRTRYLQKIRATPALPL